MLLRHTFCHLPGVGASTEQRLWSAGLTTWDQAIAAAGRLTAIARRASVEAVQESARRHTQCDAVWFAAGLRSADSWRLFADFRDRCAYLDVETTGMGPADVVTTIALYDGRSVRTYIRGQNLPDFVQDVQAYRLLVTYNGKSFDVPVLRREFGCRLDQAHIDLRHVLAGLGLTGGLKACERRLGIARPGMEELDGYAAVLLWRRFARYGDERALQTLLAYNAQDTLNLERLVVHAHNRRLADLSAPFAAGYVLPAPASLTNPFTPDPDSVRRVSRGLES